MKWNKSNRWELPTAFSVISAWRFCHTRYMAVTELTRLNIINVQHSSPICKWNYKYSRDGRIPRWIINIAFLLCALLLILFCPSSLAIRYILQWKKMSFAIVVSICIINMRWRQSERLYLWIIIWRLFRPFLSGRKIQWDYEKHCWTYLQLE